MSRIRRFSHCNLISIGGLFGWIVGGAFALAEPAAAELEFFEKQVRPILAEHCFECHGAGDDIQGGLRLDSMEGWLRGGDTGPAVVAGEPDESMLLAVVRYEHDFYEMPPEGKLPDAKIAVLEEWVRRGAVGPATADESYAQQPAMTIEEGREFWAYRPLTSPAVPSHAENPIDAFVLEQLRAADLEQNPPASREVLVRRLFFDLHGLPPTPEEIEAFLVDEQADAYERLVDRLLASPRFGERWGRHWLDVVRFGESLTLRGFVLAEAWRYRDYVIQFFNDDRPFDAFVREQVAGDLLPGDTVEARQRQTIATTFLALGNTNLEDQDKKQLDMDVVDEQLDTLGKAFLAQTIGCARCHDHKFDPIPTHDYYAMAGILRNVQTLEHANVSHWKHIPLPLPEEEEQRLADKAAEIARFKSEVARVKEEILAINAEVNLDDFKNPTVLPVKELPGIVVDDTQARQVGHWTESKWSERYVGRGYLHDENEQKGEKSLTFLPALPRDGKYEVRFAYTASDNRATNVPVTVFSADGEKTILVNQRQPPAPDGYFISLGEYNFEKDGQSFVLVGTEETDGHVIADAVQFLPVGETNSQLASSSSESEEFGRLAEKRNELGKLEARIKELEKTAADRPQVIGVVERDEVTDCQVHIRGTVHSLGEVAPRGFLQVVPATEAAPAKLPDDQSGRVELAEWLTAESNPLTPRVFVNRCWHWLFGAGLVRTTDNFGTTGELPSHPELLDHLATEFVESGWSVKHLVRAIVLSDTYRQASSESAAGLEHDPENRLLWRMNRRRLEAESLRDAMLLVAGNMDFSMGGPTYRSGLKSDYGYDGTSTRRSVYLPVFRNALPEIFEVFDFADPSVTVGVRNVSTVAPQALFLLNHPFVHEQASATAARLVAQAEDDYSRLEELRLERAFRLLLGRGPSEAEAELARSFLASQQQEEIPEEQAWAALVQSLFASIDFRYRD